MVDRFGTGHVTESEIVKRVRDLFDMKPSGIIKSLDLKRPQSRATAAYGHFGRENEGFRWELTDKYQALK